jgi:hypothetical protein
LVRVFLRSFARFTGFHITEFRDIIGYSLVYDSTHGKLIGGVR